jgi:membrane-associated phospholipid phosphatase
MTAPGLTRSICLLQFLFASALEAQHAIRWWEAALTAGVVAGATVFDRGVDDWIQDQRSSRSNALARVFKHGGQPEAFLTVGGGLLAAGVVSGRADLRRRGGRVLFSVGLAGITSGAIKELGRVRPADTRDPDVFKPFTRNESFPSGHTTVAFALAASLSEEIHAGWATALLYAGATGTAWSRLNDHRHWFSDVLGGAAVGITAAKVVEGRWRIFGLGPPKVLIEPGGAARVEWTVRF